MISQKLPVRLGVNIDHVATVRQARRALEPDPVAAAVLAILGGADGITVHLREDRRHIQDRDLRILRQTVTSRLNLELAANDDVLAIACAVRPDEATLVPEKREELTTEGGLDVLAHRTNVEKAIGQLKNANIEVSVFIDPDPNQIAACRDIGAHAVELQTARYSEAATKLAREGELTALIEAADHATRRGLAVHMGHGLTYDNVLPVARIPNLRELNIGHSIVSRAVLVGMERAVREMKAAIRGL
jgi:pyridoxine 5-phosphate synthase